jgi:hypothetical protein
LKNHINAVSSYNARNVQTTATLVVATIIHAAFDAVKIINRPPATSRMKTLPPALSAKAAILPTIEDAKYTSNFKNLVNQL